LIVAQKQEVWGGGISKWSIEGKKKKGRGGGGRGKKVRYIVKGEPGVVVNAKGKQERGKKKKREKRVKRRLAKKNVPPPT